MKFKYFIPLFFFDLVSLFLIFFCFNIIKPGLNSFFLMIIGFSISYFFCIFVTTVYKDVVVRIKMPMPYIIPFVIYVVITIIDFIVNFNGNLQIFIIKLFLAILSIVTYVSGTLFLITGLTKNIKKNHTNIINYEPGITKKRILLINPSNSNLKDFSLTATVPPMGLGVIASLTPNKYEVKLIDENFTEFQYEEADLVGITAFTSNINRAYEIAKIYREKNIPVVIGGIHATVCSEEVSLYADTVLIGEAEYIWYKLLNDFESGNMQKFYKGDFPKADEIPTPRRELFDYRYLFGTIQASRGCPFNCSFCAVSTINGREYRPKCVDSILDELESIPQKFVYFLDDNILGYGKDSEQRAIDLFKGMVKRKLKKQWFCQASINFGSNDEILYWARKSGLKMVFLGLESPDPEELLGMNKKINIKMGYENALKNINKHGIAILGSFIYGSDTETVESMRKKTDYISKNRIDIVEVKVFTPLPGTKLYQDMDSQSRLLYKNFPKDWEKYNLTDVVFQMKKISSEDFIREMNKAIKKLLAPFNLIKKFFKTLIHTKRLDSAFWALNSNLTYVISKQVAKK